LSWFFGTRVFIFSELFLKKKIGESESLNHNTCIDCGNW
jgi:hypothetical protein